MQFEFEKKKTKSYNLHYEVFVNKKEEEEEERDSILLLLPAS
jgi:hypothetical protein